MNHSAGNYHNYWGGAGLQIKVQEEKFRKLDPFLSSEPVSEIEFFYVLSNTGDWTEGKKNIPSRHTTS
jgi:hypothetical protein